MRCDDCRDECAMIGPELDARIAEEVMGWRRAVMLSGQPLYPPGMAREANVFGHTVPEYSTSIAAAWEVVEKLRNWPGGHWWLHLWQVAGVREEWRASFTFGGMAAVHPKLEATANTAPLAICLAALKAMGKP